MYKMKPIELIETTGTMIFFLDLCILNLASNCLIVYNPHRPKSIPCQDLKCFHFLIRIFDRFDDDSNLVNYFIFVML